MNFFYLLSFVTLFWIQATSKYALADPADKYLRYDDANGTEVGINRHEREASKSKKAKGTKGCSEDSCSEPCNPYYGYTCYGKECVCLHYTPPSSPTDSSDSLGSALAANGVCFSTQDTVMTPSGRKLLGDIEANDRVLTISDDEGKLKYESVLLDAHPLPDVEALFLKIKTPNRDIMLTPKHFIYVGETVETSEPVKSGEVELGDSLLIYSSDGSLKAERVWEIETVRARGISHPIVSSGKILVNDVLASVYSDLAPTALDVVQQHQILWFVRQCFKFSSTLAGVFHVRGSNGVPLVANYFLQHLVGVKM